MQLPQEYSKCTPLQRRLVREEYVRQQNGRCMHCGNSLTAGPSSEFRSAWINEDLFPPNFFKHPIHLHHCHKTDMTIGAIHAQCNAWLWQYKGE